MHDMTEAQAAAWAMEHVMGLHVSPGGGWWLDKRGRAKWRAESDREHGMYAFSPRTDANDAGAMLKAWCDAEPGRAVVWSYHSIDRHQVCLFDPDGAGSDAMRDTFETAAFDAVYAVVTGDGEDQ
jgi:hypothetical protein